MKGDRRDATARISVLLGALFGALWVLALPALAVDGPDASALTVHAVVVLGCAAVALLGRTAAPAVVAALVAPPATWHGPDPLVSGRVTDAVAHPVRPRAPGND